MKIFRSSHKGALACILSGLCYGFVGYFGMSAIRLGMSVYDMLFWRFLLATIILFLLIVHQYKEVLKNYISCLKMVAFGALCYGMSAMFYFIASTYIGSGLAMVIFFTYPALVILLNIICYKAKIEKIYYIAFFVIMLGMLMLLDINQLKFELIGIGFSICSALFYAIYIVGTEKIEVDPIISTLSVSFGCTLTCFLAAYLSSSISTPCSFELYGHIVGLAIICTILPILLLLYGMRYVSSEKASILSVLEPVSVLIVGVVLLGEVVSPLQILGTIVVLIGALITLLPKNQ